MPVVKKWAYFDHAGVAPLPSPTVDVLIEFARANAANGVADWNRWRATVEKARQLGANYWGLTLRKSPSSTTRRKASTPSRKAFPGGLATTW